MNRMPTFAPILTLVCLFIASTAQAEMITFDEILPANSNCCYLTTEYAAMGVTFVTTDDGSIWGGMSNGNPGAWFLEGTNGPAFLGFNGDSFSATMLFDAPVSQFSLDVAPSIGWYSPDDVFTLEGTRDGVLVDRVSTQIMGFAEWMTVELAGEIDAVRMVSEGPSFPNTYGVDNLNWQVVAALPVPDEPDAPTDPTEPADGSVEIDVKPWHDRNVVNPFSRGGTRVALFGSEDFNIRSVDTESLRMGPDSANPMKRPRAKDLDGDGFLDLVTTFRTMELGLALGDHEVCLSGTMFDGQTFEGCDSIDTVPRKRGRTHSETRSRR